MRQGPLMMSPSSVSAGHLLLGSQPTRKSSLFPVGKKRNFHLASGYKLEIASGLGMGHLSTCPFCSRTPSGAHLCRPCARCLSLCESVCAPGLLCLERLVLLVSPISSGSYAIYSCSLLRGFLSPEGRDLVEPSGLEKRVPGSISNTWALEDN